MLSQIWEETVCKCYKHLQKSLLVRKECNTVLGIACIHMKQFVVVWITHVLIDSNILGSKYFGETT